jgi:hypothetical protein
MKPIGHYVPLQKNSPSSKVIEGLIAKYGYFFQKLSTEELLSILSFCTLSQETPSDRNNSDQIGLVLQAYLWDKKMEILKNFYPLPKEILFCLIPFIHQLISVRM